MGRDAIYNGLNGLPVGVMDLIQGSAALFLAVPAISMTSFVMAILRRRKITTHIVDYLTYSLFGMNLFGGLLILYAGVRTFAGFYSLRGECLVNYSLFHAFVLGKLLLGTLLAIERYLQTCLSRYHTMACTNHSNVAVCLTVAVAGIALSAVYWLDITRLQKLLAGRSRHSCSYFVAFNVPYLAFLIALFLACNALSLLLFHKIFAGLKGRKLRAMSLQIWFPNVIRLEKKVRKNMRTIAALVCVDVISCFPLVIVAFVSLTTGAKSDTVNKLAWAVAMTTTLTQASVFVRRVPVLRLALSIFFRHKRFHNAVDVVNAISLEQVVSMYASAGSSTSVRTLTRSRSEALEVSLRDGGALWESVALTTVTPNLSQNASNWRSSTPYNSDS